MSDNDPTLARLEDQINWYEARNKSNQYKFKFLKAIVIGCAALIPFLSTLEASAMGGGGLGMGIAIIEGLQQMIQYHSN